MTIISNFFKNIAKDSLYRNSIYLMLSTAVMSFLGFFFWIINARVYSTEQVGIGTALISAITLISSFSLLGLGNGLIRYLPTSERKNKKINTSFTIIALMSILISVIYLTFIKTFSPKLLFVRENIIFSLSFIFFAVISSLNIISENVFVAYRTTKFVLIKNTISSVTKLILAIFLVAFGAYGIFLSVGIAITVAVIFSMIFLILRFNYLPRPVIDIIIVKKMTIYSLGNYTAGLIAGLPGTVLPLLIINLIAAKFSAFFFMDMMIASTLFIIPTATSQSLFAEGSNSEAELKEHFKKAVKIVSIIIIPIIILIFLFGDYILLAFGKEYSSDGFILLKFLSVSGIFFSINEVGGIILKVKYKIKLMILLSLINTIIILLLSIILIKFTSLGIIGVGVGWIAGQCTTAIIYLFLIKKILY
jgi:O-antigen/teichoic acid export membrane protein